MMFDIGTHSYVAFAKCGCAIAICHDAPGFEKETSSEVAGYIKDGYSIERLPNDEAAHRFVTPETCPHQEIA